MAMEMVVAPVGASRGALWTGRILSALPALFLLFDAVMKLVKPSFVIEGTVRMGYPENAIVPLGVVLLILCAICGFLILWLHVFHP